MYNIGNAFLLSLFDMFRNWMRQGSLKIERQNIFTPKNMPTIILISYSLILSNLNLFFLKSSRCISNSKKKSWGRGVSYSVINVRNRRASFLKLVFLRHVES